MQLGLRHLGFLLVVNITVDRQGEMALSRNVIGDLVCGGWQRALTLEASYDWWMMACRFVIPSACLVPPRVSVNVYSDLLLLL